MASMQGIPVHSCSVCLALVWMIIKSLITLDRMFVFKFPPGGTLQVEQGDGWKGFEQAR